MNAKPKKKKKTASEPAESAPAVESADTIETAETPASDAAAVDEAFAGLAEEAELSSIQAQLEEVTTERDGFFDKWKRAQAELENYRRRVQNEMQELRRYQALSLARDLLPGLDNLERAIQASETSENVADLAEGVRMVMQEFESVLARHSVVPIDALEQPFDPNFHEAIQQMPSPDHDPMTVIHEVQRGYQMHDRVVRPSKVIVSSAPPSTESSDEADESPREEPETDAATDDATKPAD